MSAAWWRLFQIIRANRLLALFEVLLAVERRRQLAPHHEIPVNLVAGSLKLPRQGLTPAAPFIEKLVDHAAPIGGNLGVANLERVDASPRQLAEKISKLKQHILADTGCGRSAFHAAFIVGCQQHDREPDIAVGLRSMKPPRQDSMSSGSTNVSTACARAQSYACGSMTNDSDAITAMEQLHRACRDPRPQLLAQQRVRHRLVMLRNLDVIIEAGLALLPLGVDVGRSR